MRLILNRQLYSSTRGTMTEGSVVDFTAEEAAHLLDVGAARRADPPTIVYDTKVVRPEAPQVSARLPFRDLPVSDTKPTTVVIPSDPVLSATNVSEPRTADLGRRRRR